jgi:hypothetical protein
MPNRSLVYFHSLSYDFNFIINKLERVDRPIIKQGRTLSINGVYRGKSIVFKDSYSIITSKLKDFPRMFKLESGEKEVFPYQYYSSELLEDGNSIGIIKDALEFIKTEVREQFVKNFDMIKRCRIDDNRFRLDLNTNYYCDQDVNSLRQDFEKFRADF